MVTTTLSPGRNGCAGSTLSGRTRTGTRCTTLVKFPVALSGGSSENRAPVAGDRGGGGRGGRRLGGVGLLLRDDLLQRQRPHALKTRVPFKGVGLRLLPLALRLTPARSVAPPRERHRQIRVGLRQPHLVIAV